VNFDGFLVQDRAYGGPVFVVSPEGGVDIEKVAEENPEAIIKEAIDITKGPQPQQLERLARGLKFKDHQIPDATNQMKSLYDLFLGLDATQVEVNPFAETKEGESTLPLPPVTCGPTDSTISLLQFTLLMPRSTSTTMPCLDKRKSMLCVT